MPGHARRTPDHPRIVSLPAGTTLWRVSRDATGLRYATSGRSQRFSPLLGPDGSSLPVWYGADSRVGALFESVFHDIRPNHAAPRVFANAYLDRVLAQVVVARELRVVDLTSVGLHAIGVTRQALIESTSRQYAWTASVAQRLLDHAPDIDGFQWTSRAHDRSRCVALLARADGEPALVRGDELPLALGAGTGLELLRSVATDARITVVIPDPGTR